MPEKELLDEKQRLRESLRRKRLALDPEEGLRLSSLAAAHLLGCEAWQKARSVALYMAVRGETDCADLLAAAAAQGKRVLLPRCSREEKGRMVFAVYEGPDDLRPGPYGIMEPRPELPEGPEPDVLVAPGLAFDREGRRLGAGGGYYDRYLARPGLAQTLRIGLCYAFQILEALPGDPWDMPMHALCSEQGLLWTLPA